MKWSDELARAERIGADTDVPASEPQPPPSCREPGCPLPAIVTPTVGDLCSYHYAREPKVGPWCDWRDGGPWYCGMRSVLRSVHTEACPAAEPTVAAAIRARDEAMLAATTSTYTSTASTSGKSRALNRNGRSESGE